MLNLRMLYICEQMCEHRDALKAQIGVKEAEIERMVAQVKKAETEHMFNVEQLRLDFGGNVREEANKLQAQQGLVIEELKVALANETANVSNEREAKQKAIQER